MRVIQSPFVWMLICFPFILAGAVNLGGTGFVFAVPFLLIFLYQLRRIPRPFALLIGTALSVLLLGFMIDQKHNRFLHPILSDGGANIQLSCGWEAWEYPQNKMVLPFLTPPNIVRQKDEFPSLTLKITRHFVPCNEPSFTVTAVISKASGISGYLTHYLQIENKAGNRYLLSHHYVDNAIRMKYLTTSTPFTSNQYAADWSRQLSLLMYWPGFLFIQIHEVKAFEEKVFKSVSNVFNFG